MPDIEPADTIEQLGAEHRAESARAAAEAAPADVRAMADALTEATVTPPPIAESDLHQIIDQPHSVWHNSITIRLAAELLKLRAYATDHEGACNTLCPRCGIEVGVPVRTAELQVAEAAIRELQDLAMQRAVLITELRDRVGELEAERKPDGYVVAASAPTASGCIRIYDRLSFTTVEGARNGAAQVGDPAKVYELRAVES